MEERERIKEGMKFRGERLVCFFGDAQRRASRTRRGESEEVKKITFFFPLLFRLFFFTSFHYRSSNTASLCFRCFSCLSSTASICPRRLLLPPLPRLPVVPPSPPPPPAPPSSTDSVSHGNASRLLPGTRVPPLPGTLLGPAAPPPRALSAAFLQNIFLTAARAGETKEAE